MCITRPLLGFALGAVLSGALFVSCDDACLELAKTICTCEPSTLARQRCEVRVSREAESLAPSAADLERCTKLLDSCNCDELAAGRIATCGLAPEPGAD